MISLFGLTAEQFNTEFFDPWMDASLRVSGLVIMPFVCAAVAYSLIVSASSRDNSMGLRLAFAGAAGYTILAGVTLFLVCLLE